MSFRQTYKGIFQFKDQTALERAMAENQAEAMGADALGLQDCYHSEGAMLFDIDIVGTAQDWEEMSVAIATLAMHASRGFLHAFAFDGGEIGPRKEYFEASEPQDLHLEPGSALPPSEDFFPMNLGTTYQYQGSRHGEPVDIKWIVRKNTLNGQDYYYFEDPTQAHVHYNDFWDGTYYRKNGSLVEAIMAGNAHELAILDPADRYMCQAVYNNHGKPGDTHYAIWKDSDHFLIFTQEEPTDLQLPIGSLKGCMTIRMELYHVMGSDMYQETQYQYFYPGIGLVRCQKVDSSLELVYVNP